MLISWLKMLSKQILRKDQTKSWKKAAMNAEYYEKIKQYKTEWWKKAVRT